LLLEPVRIVTDSTADLPARLARELEISVVPCQVTIAGTTYRDGVDLTLQEFIQKMARALDLPRTSQPPMKAFVETYRRLLIEQDAAAVLSIHVASSVSGTVNAASAAAQTLPDPARVVIIDSGQLSMGLGLAVVEAARLARAGATADEVSQAVHGMLPRLWAAAMIDTLENLYKGGRIRSVTATLGQMLRIKPLIVIHEGEIRVVEKVRTRSRALKRLEALVHGWGSLAEALVLHTGAEALARDLADALDGVVPGRSLGIEPAGSALTAHLGLGAVGVCALTTAEGA
jgi:DegV family protein with EDD domain